MPTTTGYEILNNWINTHVIAWSLVLLWSLLWKGLALWKAAERNQRYWFMTLLVLNTLGILDIFYVYVIARKYKVEVVNN